MRKLLFIIVAVSLLGCETPSSRHETYDLINAEMGKAVQTKTSPAPDPIAAALLPPLQIDMPKAVQPAEERFSLSFNNIPAQQFFVAVASGTRYNMLVHPEVAGTISANLKDVTLLEALDAVRELYGYDYKVEGTRIYIKPLSIQTKVFHVNYLMANRKGTSNTRVTSGSIGDRTGGNSQGNNQNQNQNQGGNSNPQGGTNIRQVSAKISTESTSDFWGELKDALDAIVGAKDGRSVVISPQSGIVVVRAMPDELRNVTAYLKATQLSVDRQVILEAKILEVQLNDGYQTGVNWAIFKNGDNHRGSAGLISSGTLLNASTGAFTSAGDPAINGVAGSSIGATGTPGKSLFGLAFATSNFAALISFLETQGTVHVLSSPRIATMNNQKAVLKVGTDEFFVTNVNATTTTTAATTTTIPSLTVEPFFSGVMLDVTPQIDENGNIILHVHPSVSQVSTVNKTVDLGQLGNTITLPLPASDTSETDSVVRGRDGQIVAIGGLMRQASVSDRSQIPGLGNVPGVGAAFRNTNQSTQKRELVILLKPTVVEGGSDWSQDMLESQQRIQKLAPRGMLEQ